MTTAYISLIGPVDDVSANKLLDMLQSDVDEQTDTLYFLISTEGGGVAAGIALYTLLKALPYTIIMHNISNVDSIGNVVFLAGDKRFTVSHGVFLLHGVKSGGMAEKIQRDVIREKLSMLESDEKRICNILMQHTKLPRDLIEDLFSISGASEEADFALEHGIVHEICDFTLPQGTKMLVVQTG
jgi:ATP-dependent Clp protease, protease subunit